MDVARACVVVCAYGSDAMHSSFFPAVVFCVYSWMWRLAYLLSWFPFVFWHWPHSVCTPCIPVLVGCLLPPLPPILSSRLGMLHCFLHQFLPFGLALGWGLDVWGDVAVITPGSFSSFCVCVLSFFQVSILTILLVWFAWGLVFYCLRHWVYTFTVSGMLVAFLPSLHFGGCLSFVIILCRLFSPFLPGGSAFLVTWCLGYFGGFVVGALDIFWLDWTLCSLEVLPSRWCLVLTDLDG